MPRTGPGWIPKLCRHKASGQSVVTIGGRDIYLGRHGSDEARENYDRLVATWLASGRRSVALEPAATGYTINQLILAYVEHARGYYQKDGKPTREFANIQIALRPLRHLFGRTQAADFGPKALKAVRAWMFESTIVLERPDGAPRDAKKELVIRKRSEIPARKYLNESIKRIVRMFRWGAEEELAPASVYHALRAVAGLRLGRTAAREAAPVRPVDWADVEAVLPHLPRPVAAMVQVQWYSGCRPGEVVQMRMQDLDRSGEVWIYRPHSHKTQHHGRDRIIALGPKAQAVIEPFLRLDGGYLFQPIDAVEELRSERGERRTTPRYGRKRPRKSDPKWVAGQCYAVDSYRRSITRACEHAGVRTWTPNRLRHARATAIRARFGLEAAQVALGHASAEVTQLYAQRDRRLAMDVAKEIG